MVEYSHKGERAMRYSKQRETVYQTLKSMCSHPDASQIYQLVREKIPNVSLGTVYRNLGELCQAGLVHRVSVENSAERFDARTDPHAHFVCHGCGCVSDVSLEDVTVQHGLDGVSHCKVELYGTCDQCRNKN